MFNSLGYGTWFFFASFLVITMIWSYFLFPETKGLTVDQMDVIYFLPFVINYLFSEYNQPGHRGVPHTRHTKIQALEEQAQATDKFAWAKYFEEV
jgi:hypothetical protein